MTIRHQRLIAHFLSALEKQQRITYTESVNPVFLKLLSRDDLLEIIDWRFEIKILRDIDLEKMSIEELLLLIGDNLTILAHTISKWNKRLNTMVTFSQEEVDEFFEQTQNGFHYLRTKPVEEWDGYDRNNYLSMLAKAGVTQRVFALFTSEVAEKDKYIVYSPSGHFYDTEDEAIEIIQELVDRGDYAYGDLQVFPLWKIK